MYVKYIISNIYAKYGDNGNNEYLEKRLLVQLEGFVSKFLESNAKIEGFATIESLLMKLIELMVKNNYKVEYVKT